MSEKEKVEVKSEAKTKSDSRRALAKRMIQKRQKKGSSAAFSEDFKLELKRIVWPTRQTVMKSSTLIFIIMTVATLLIFVFDLAFAELFLKLKKIG